MMTRLITERLMMRRAQPDDLDAMHALVSHYDVVKMTATWPWPADRAFTASRSVPFAADKGMVGPVFQRGQLVGVMGISSLDGDRAEMGYMFVPEVWGRGFATEMGRELIAHCWQRYDWSKVTACVFDDNGASDRVLLKLGFTYDGPCRGYCKARGQELPTRTYHLLRP